MKLRPTLSLLVLAATAFQVQSQVRAPKVGMARYQTGALHAIYGLGGNFIVGPTVQDTVSAAAFSDEFGIFANGVGLTLVGEEMTVLGQWQCAEPQPVMGIGERADTAIAWIPSAATLVHWNGRTFASVSAPDLAHEGKVTAVNKQNADAAEVLVIANDGSVARAIVSLQTGLLRSWSALPGVQGEAFTESGYVLSVREGKLHILNESNASSLELPLPSEQVSFERAASKAIHISSRSDTANWILYRENGHFELAELPGIGSAK